MTRNPKYHIYEYLIVSCYDTHDMTLKICDAILQMFTPLEFYPKTPRGLVTHDGIHADDVVVKLHIPDWKPPDWSAYLILNDDTVEWKKIEREFIQREHLWREIIENVCRAKSIVLFDRCLK